MVLTLGFVAPLFLMVFDSPFLVGLVMICDGFAFCVSFMGVSLGQPWRRCLWLVRCVPGLV